MQNLDLSCLFLYEDFSYQIIQLNKAKCVKYLGIFYDGRCGLIPDFQAQTNQSKNN